MSGLRRSPRTMPVTATVSPHDKLMRSRAMRLALAVLLVGMPIASALQDASGTTDGKATDVGREERSCGGGSEDVTGIFRRVP